MLIIQSQHAGYELARFFIAGGKFMMMVVLEFSENVWVVNYIVVLICTINLGSGIKNCPKISFEVDMLR